MYVAVLRFRKIVEDEEHFSYLLKCILYYQFSDENKNPFRGCFFFT